MGWNGQADIRSFWQPGSLVNGMDIMVLLLAEHVILLLGKSLGLFSWIRLVLGYNKSWDSHWLFSSNPY